MAERVVVGISGGVDSAVAAYLLKKQGLEVIGITFKFTDTFDATDAIEVAKSLEIEHHIVDYRKEFKERVMDVFLNEYKKGLTPNPCVICNRYVKMNFLYEQMKEYNCEYLATGHYAKILDSKLYRSADLNKDQTYFLSSVPQKIIARLILPLEGINKEEVRKIATSANLVVASKKDSTDVCFITSTFKDYMEQHLEETPGDIVNIENNEVLGQHKGLSFHTIGQRKGLGIGTTDKLFVVGKNPEKNILYVALGENNDYLTSDSCLLKNINIISYHHPSFATAKFRYRSKEVPVSIEYVNENEIKVSYLEPTKGVTPGQNCAIYMGEECIGGGTITEVYKNNEKLWYL